MTIQEAIKAAGPGEKITNGNKVLRIPVKSDSRIREVYDSEGNEVDWSVIWPKHLTGDNWQVVEPERIEVGDIVQGPCDKDGEVLGVECEVLKHGKILTRLGLLGENSICCCNKYLTKDLTLIRKGPKKHVKLREDDVEWIVNDVAELGVKIGGQLFFLYKGSSLVYDGKHDDGSRMMYRPVFKREFGECCHPINYRNPEYYGTVSLSDSDDWRPMPLEEIPIVGTERGWHDA